MGSSRKEGAAPSKETRELVSHVRLATGVAYMGLAKLYEEYLAPGLRGGFSWYFGLLPVGSQGVFAAGYRVAGGAEGRLGPMRGRYIARAAQGVGAGHSAAQRRRI